MEYELIDAGPSRKSMKLKFSEEDVNNAFDQTYQEINNQVRLRGFRKGKAPRRVLENKFSKEAADSARQLLLDEKIPETAKAENVEILGTTRLVNTSDLPKPGEAYEANVEFDVMPEFELPEYKGLEIAEQPVNVSEKDVDEALVRYQKSFTNYEEVDEPARVGDILKVDFVTTSGDEEIMAMKEQRLRVEGEMLFGLPVPDLETKFTGAKKGDKVELTITLPDDHPNAERRGKEALTVVDVLAVERGELPELNDGFAKGLGFESMDDFRQRLNDNLIREGMVAARSKEEEEIIEKLLEKADFPVPESLVKAEAQNLVQARGRQLAGMGVAANAALFTQLEKYRLEAEKEATKKVRWSFIATKIAEKENIQVTNEDLSTHIEALAQAYGTTPAKIVQRIRSMNGISPMLAEIQGIKVIQFITNNTKGKAPTTTEDTKAINADAAKIAQSPSGEGESE